MCISMETWPSHIDRLERQYNKAFSKEPLFGADIINIIHKRVKFFFHSCNTTDIEDVELGALTEFGSLKKII